MRVYYDRDADLNLIKGKKVVIVGYGSRPSSRLSFGGRTRHPCARRDRPRRSPSRWLAIADDDDLLALDQVQVGVAIVINTHGVSS